MPSLPILVYSSKLRNSIRHPARALSFQSTYPSSVTGYLPPHCCCPHQHQHRAFTPSELLNSGLWTIIVKLRQRVRQGKSRLGMVTSRSLKVTKRSSALNLWLEHTLYLVAIRLVKRQTRDVSIPWGCFPRHAYPPQAGGC